MEPSLAAWVLVIVLKMGSGTAAVTVDMPTRSDCVSAVVQARQESQTSGAFCITRDAAHK